MAELITPSMLMNFARQRGRQRKYSDIPLLFLGKTNALILSGGAVAILGLSNTSENHVIIQQEDEKLYIKKVQKPNVDTWLISKYKNNGLRIAKTTLCNFLRNRFSVAQSENIHFLLIEAGELGFEITKPSKITPKKDSDV